MTKNALENMSPQQLNDYIGQRFQGGSLTKVLNTIDASFKTALELLIKNQFGEVTLAEKPNPFSASPAPLPQPEEVSPDGNAIALAAIKMAGDIAAAAVGQNKSEADVTTDSSIADAPSQPTIGEPEDVVDADADALSPMEQVLSARKLTKREGRRTDRLIKRVQAMLNNGSLQNAMERESKIERRTKKFLKEFDKAIVKQTGQSLRYVDKHIDTMSHTELAAEMIAVFNHPKIDKLLNVGGTKRRPSGQTKILWRYVHNVLPQTKQGMNPMRAFHARSNYHVPSFRNKVTRCLAAIFGKVALAGVSSAALVLAVDGNFDNHFPNAEGQLERGESIDFSHTHSGDLPGKERGKDQLTPKEAVIFTGVVGNCLVNGFGLAARMAIDSADHITTQRIDMFENPSMYKGDNSPDLISLPEGTRLESRKKSLERIAGKDMLMQYFFVPNVTGTGGDVVAINLGSNGYKNIEPSCGISSKDAAKVVKTGLLPRTLRR